MNTEEALRSALDAQAGSYEPSARAWADNRARLRRRARTRRTALGLAAATVAGSAAVAVAFARPGAETGTDTVRPVGPASPVSPSPFHGFGEVDLRKMDPAEAKVLADRCVRSFATLPAPAADYRLIYALPGSHVSGTDRNVVVLHAREQLLVCEGLVSSPEQTQVAVAAPGWITEHVDGGVVRYGKDGSWAGFGRYTAEVARIEVMPLAGDAPVAAHLGNGFWYASGVGSPPSEEKARPVKVLHPVLTAYGHDGRVLHSSLSVRRSVCYELPDGSYVDAAERPLAVRRDPCATAHRWP